MPIYAFKCEKCDTVVEELRKLGDDTPPTSCGGNCGKCGCENGESECQFKKIPTAPNVKVKW